MRKLSMEELDRLTPQAFEMEEKTQLMLVLDNVRSALNVGSAFRTADAFALEQIFLCGITATPPHREILKTALGATETVKWKYFSTSLEALEQLRKEAWTPIAIEQATGAVFLQDFKMDPAKKYALIFGNEVDGVSNAVMKEVDGAIEIPQYGTKHSLNVSVSIGITVWDLFKNLRLQAG